MIRAATRILQGHCVELLRQEAPGSVQACVTSPPYWRLRDYETEPQAWADGWRGELGQEPSIDLYAAHMVEVFSEVRRVLRDDGTLWLNLGATVDDRYYDVPGIVADALSEHGWLLRSRFSLVKRSPLPASNVIGSHWRRHRLKVGSSKRAPAGTRHEAGYLTAQGARSGAEFASRAEWVDCPGCSECDANDGLVFCRESWGPTKATEAVLLFKKAGAPWYYADGLAVREEGPTKYQGCDGDLPNGHNVYDWLQWRNDPSERKHYASYPAFLPSFCIRAGTPEVGGCAHCGAPWARVVEPGPRRLEAGRNPGSLKDYATGSPQVPESGLRMNREQKGVGWRPTCSCGLRESVPSVVLDPFSGSGTTGKVATSLGRRSLQMELCPRYVVMAQERNAQMSFLELMEVSG